MSKKIVYFCDSCHLFLTQPQWETEEETGTVLSLCPWCGRQDITEFLSCENCGALLRKEIDESCLSCLEKRGEIGEANL